MAQSVAAGCNASLQIYGFGIVIIAGSYEPNTTAAPLAVKGKGFTVAYTSAGLHTVTLTRSALAVISGWVTMQSHTAVEAVLQFGDIDVVTARTVLILNTLSGTATAYGTPDANTRVHFGLLLASSSLNT